MDWSGPVLVVADSLAYYSSEESAMIVLQIVEKGFLLTRPALARRDALFTEHRSRVAQRAARAVRVTKVR